MKRTLALLTLSLTSLYAQTPNITSVQDGGAYTNNVAQGSVFVVKGTNLSAAGYSAATAPSYPTLINGVGITFTAVSGGNVVNALMVYLYNEGGVNQLAAVLPSNASAGAYDVRVSNGAATSNAFRTQVVSRKPGIVTADGSGSGPAQATLSGGLILARNSNVGTVGQFTTRAARLGERVDLWGTGLGPDIAADTGGTSGDQTPAGQIRVLVNGTEVTPAYAGRSAGFPGLDQIVFTIPSNTTPGCAVSIQVRAGGTLSNSTSIPVAASGDSCTPSNPNPGGSSSPFGLSTSEIQEIISRGTFTLGTWTQARTVSHTIDFNTGAAPTVDAEDSVNVDFIRYSGDLRVFNQPVTDFVLPREGACYVFDSQTIPPIPPSPGSAGFTIRQLDAGPSLTLQGPRGSRSIFKELFSFNYASEFTPAGNFLVGGSYTLNGPGSADVSSFSVSMNMPSDLVWTNRAALQTITRGGGATYTWTGGQGADLVQISGISFVMNLGVPIQIAVFNCYANPNTGSFTVPASILNRLPASGDMGIPGFPYIYPGISSLSAMTVNYSRAGNVDILMRTSASLIGQTALYK